MINELCHRVRRIRAWSPWCLSPWFLHDRSDAVDLCPGAPSTRSKAEFTRKSEARRFKLFAQSALSMVLIGGAWTLLIASCLGQEQQAKALPSRTASQAEAPLPETTHRAEQSPLSCQLDAQPEKKKRRVPHEERL